MVPIALLSTSLLIALAAVLVIMLGFAAFYAQTQSRRRASAKSEREAKEARQRDDELAHIRQRIEEIYERQQTGSETQFARVNQELEQLQMNLDAKGRQIDGVQGQLRYQLKRHEDEIAELRNQLREAVEVFAAAALPAARPSAPALPAATPPAQPQAAAPQAAAPQAPAVKPTPIQAPSAIHTPDGDAPVFAPLGEMLKDDQELLDDLFSGTDLDSRDAPALQDAPASAAPTIPPAQVPSSPAAQDPATLKEARPQSAAPEPAVRREAREVAEPAPVSPPLADESLADQLASRDDFEFVEIDPPSLADVAQAEPEAPHASWPDTDAQDETVDLTSSVSWPVTPSEPQVPEATEHVTPEHVTPETVPAHSGDGMSTGSYDDPFAEAATQFHPEPTTDLDSAQSEPVPVAPEAPAPSTEPAGQALAAELAPIEEEPVDPGATREILTSLTAVDEDTQATLYTLGINDIESIARWTRADARRMATQLPGVSEEDIMDRWIFEAQSILFERYQDELREQREQQLSA